MEKGKTNQIKKKKEKTKLRVLGPIVCAFWVVIVAHVCEWKQTKNEKNKEKKKKKGKHETSEERNTTEDRNRASESEREREKEREGSERERKRERERLITTYLDPRRVRDVLETVRIVLQLEQNLCFARNRKRFQL